MTIIDNWVGRLLLKGFQDVAVLLTRASFYTTFLINCGMGESVVTTTCDNTVVGVSKGVLHVKYFCSNKASILSKRHFMEFTGLSGN